MKLRFTVLALALPILLMLLVTPYAMEETYSDSVTRSRGSTTSYTFRIAGKFYYPFKPPANSINLNIDYRNLTQGGVTRRTRLAWEIIVTSILALYIISIIVFTEYINKVATENSTGLQELPESSVNQSVPEAEAITSKKKATKDPNEIACSKCNFTQWTGYTKCQKCGATFIH